MTAKTIYYMYKLHLYKVFKDIMNLILKLYEVVSMYILYICCLINIFK